MNASFELVEGAFGLRLGDGDLDAVRRLLLDHIGVAARGAERPSARAAQELARAAPSTGPSLPIIGSRQQAGALAACFANAVAGHSIEYDDVHNSSSTHPGVVVFPASLAAQSFADCDEDTFLQAVLVGYEVMCRVGRAARPSVQYERHFHPTGTCGGLGAAAAASRLLGLSIPETVSALGLAATVAGGGMRFAADGSSTKHLNPAAAARAGVEAALLARAGAFGGEDPVAGARGFLETYSDRVDADRLLNGLGAGPSELSTTSVKAHTCCRYNQGPIDCLLEIRNRERLRAGDVAQVRLGLMSAAVDIVARPESQKRNPQTVVDAQFSLPFGAAVALADGCAGLAQHDVDRLGDPQLKDLMERVECVVDPELDRTYPEQWAAWARVTTKAGETFGASTDYPKGDPENPLDRDELHAKFRALTEGIFSEKRRAEIFACVERLPHPGSLKALLERLQTDV